jgi:transposase-like protein
MRFPIDVILLGWRRSVANPLRYRRLEEIMQERGVALD